jgi:SAM-dependent methyltransferase
VKADIRNFRLDETFDAAVCATNSLNYVHNRDELSNVFKSVAEHLRPGGWFVCDAFTERGMRLVSGQYLHVEVKGQRFVIHFTYDRQERVESADVIFPTGIETHRRIPIDPGDVEEAGRTSGLRLCDYFAVPFIPGRWYSGALCYYVLAKSGA